MQTVALVHDIRKIDIGVYRVIFSIQRVFQIPSLSQSQAFVSIYTVHENAPLGAAISAPPLLLV